MKFRSSRMITLMFFLVFVCNNKRSTTVADWQGNSCKDICRSGQIDCKSTCQKICNGNCNDSHVTNFTDEVQTCPAEYSNCSDCLSKCKRCSGDDGLCQGYCSDTNQGCVNSTTNISSCQNISNGSPPFNMSTCILSFETDAENVTNGECRFSDSGVWLLNNTHKNQLQINITRNATLRPKTPICFVTGCQTCSQTSDCVTIVLQVCYKCVIVCVMCRVCYKCVTSVLQVCYKCVTSVLQVCYKCVTSVLQVCYKCVTSVLQVCYKCVTVCVMCRVCYMCDVYFTDLLTRCSKSNDSEACGNMTCVDPNTFCDNAGYDPNCTRNDSNCDIITLNGSSAVCSKCGNAFQKTEGNVVINFTLPHDSNSNTNYFAEMKRLNQMILKEMGNKSSVSVSLDDAKGIFVKQTKEEEFKSIYFMYSNQVNFNIIEDKTQLPNFDRTFSVPKEAFEKVSNLTNDTLFASLLRFPNFPKDHMNSTLLNHEVYSIDMGEGITNLTTTFNLTFRNILPNSGDASCNSWDGQGLTPNWTTDGCNTSYISDQVTCSCQHLTFFAVLMTIPKNNMSTSDIRNLTYLTSLGCGLSLFFLSIALFMHFLIRRGQASVSVHILINLFLALFLLNLSFLVNESVAKIGSDSGCKLMAGTMHCFMLSTFTWFGLQALHLCLQLTQNVARIQNYVIKLCIAGWVPPALVVTAIYVSQKYGIENIVSDTGKTVSICWITDPTVHYVVNIGYYSAIFLFTFLTFVVMLRWLCLLRRKCPTITSSGKTSRSSDALTIMGLCCILGLSWGFAFFAYGPMQIPAYYIFTVLNSCQGFFLFIYYYKSSRLVGEAETLAEESSTTTVVENPYSKPKMF
ncbi:hypothetical protein QTP70_031182 [Hemibagrus guttatus]|uniref:Uncharacterized protein n=1 Tax=Hemibagrus guttatus TaxID=175788 RepID=A0AAE0PRL6_9TELE|nr:hypothetical protein QTP70_031182 [Hemibagrus guttatus]